MPKRKGRATQSWAQWKPEPGVGAETVFDEALGAAKAQRFDEALAKHLWFHRHALEIRPSLFGVRLSYALSAWVELSKCFPPALKALHRVRDTAARQVKTKPDIWSSFSDFRSINHYLEDAARSLRLFKWLVARRPDEARRVYRLMEEDLYAAGEFTLCGRFLEAASFDAIRSGYKVNLRLAKDPEFGADFAESAMKRFSIRAKRLVHLLVLNHRMADARAVARKVGRLLKSKEVDGQIKLLLKGGSKAPSL